MAALVEIGVGAGNSIAAAAAETRVDDGEAFVEETGEGGPGEIPLRKKTHARISERTTMIAIAHRKTTILPFMTIPGLGSPGKGE